MPRDRVVLKDHDAGWAPCFDAVTQRVRAALSTMAIEWHHIGSTAIPGIKAKPILDILGAADNLEDFDAQRPALEQLGFVWKGEYGIPGRRYCVLYNTDRTASYVHMHVFHRAHPEAEAHLLFRDYLRAFPARARAYESLKITLAGTSARQDYSSGKDSFIQTILAEARAWNRRD